ncbi:hypothetical protein [Yoonia vestfoldensis]|uniref:hypothetical protein n=1 Tax=Yoonia vestfoldensis TaxID=245188 RepID=UPI0013A58C14|nr:hypothetical protein [Yoonia vestfoldensis]
MDETLVTVPATHFYRWIIAATLTVLGGSFTLFSVIEGRVTSLDDDVKELLRSYSHMDGRLQSLIPLLDRAVLERASVEPSAFGIAPIENANFGSIPSGWSVINRDVVMDLENSGKITLSSDTVDMTSPYLFVDCNSEIGANSGPVSCQSLDWRDPSFESSDAEEFLQQFESLRLLLE